MTSNSRTTSSEPSKLSETRSSFVSAGLCARRDRWRHTVPQARLDRDAIPVCEQIALKVCGAMLGVLQRGLVHVPFAGPCHQRRADGKIGIVPSDLALGRACRTISYYRFIFGIRNRKTRGSGAHRIVGAIRSGVRRIERLTPLPTLRSPIVARYTPHAVEGRGVGNCYCAAD